MNTWIIMTAATTVSPDVIQKWIEPTSIITVLSILTFVQAVAIWKLLKIYFDTVKTHTAEQKDVFDILRTSTAEITKAITELTTIVKERLDRD